MISLNQVLYLILAGTIISLLTLGLHKLEDLFSFDHRARLKLFKTNIVLFWLAALFGFIFPSSSVSKFIRNLTPQTDSIHQSFRTVSVQALGVDNQNSVWLKIMLCCYLVGLMFILFRLAHSYLSMRAILVSSSSANVCGTLIRISKNISTPFCFGILKPQIFLPVNYLTNCSQDDLMLIVSHENTHILNSDPQWKLISLVTRSFLFFFPPSWILHNKFELEMEIVCDEMTIHKTKTSVRRYGQILIEAIEQFQNSETNPMFTYMSKTNLSRRIHAMKAKTSHHPFLSLIFGSALLVGGTATIAGTSTAAAWTSFSGTWKGAGIINYPDGSSVKCSNIQMMLNQTPTELEVLGGNFKCGSDQMGLDPKTTEIRGTELVSHGKVIGTIQDTKLHSEEFRPDGSRETYDSVIVGNQRSFKSVILGPKGDIRILVEGQLTR